MNTSHASVSRHTLADILALRRRHEHGSLDATATFAEVVATVRQALGRLSAAGLHAEEVHAWATAMAAVADHLWSPLRQALPEGAEEAEAQQRAFWAAHQVTPAVLGAAAAGAPFQPGGRANAGPDLQEIWALALALGCRGTLAAGDASRLWAQLAGQPPSHRLPDALMGAGRRGLGPASPGGHLRRWWGLWAAPVGWLAATVALRVAEAARLAGLPGAGR